MNIGKRGLSSIGVGKTNFGRRGIHQNISIPGTGISYRSKIVGSSKRTSSPPTQHRKTTSVPVTLSLQDDGTINYLDKKGKPLPVNLVQATKKQNRELILGWLEEQSEKYNDVQNPC